MNYSLAEIEDQVLATLALEFTPGSKMHIATSAGEISARMFLDTEYMEGVIRLLPFCLLRYQGRQTKNRDSVGLINEHELQWQIYVGAESLRNKQEPQRSAYSFLANVYDALHGKWPLSSQPLASNLPKLDGTTMTDGQFKALSPFLEVEGPAERLVVDLPRIAVYSTFFKLTVLAYTTEVRITSESGATITSEFGTAITTE
jgi:hypothetical protein